MKDSIDLKFLYENHPEFAPLPTYFIMPALILTMSSDLVQSAIKHTEFDLSKVVHGEQYLEVFGDLPTEGEISTTGSIIDVIDKRSGAVVVANCMSYQHFIIFFTLRFNICVFSKLFQANHMIVVGSCCLKIKYQHSSSEPETLEEKVRHQMK